MPSDHWMQNVVKNPGYLHRATNTPADQRIPRKKIAKAETSDNPHLRRAANLAQVFEKYRPK